jgi:hypothetical protein
MEEEHFGPNEDDDASKAFFEGAVAQGAVVWEQAKCKVLSQLPRISGTEQYP